METKEKILHISFSIFLNKGYKNTTLNNLINASELSKGAFYHYFSSKEALYIAVIDTFFLSYFRKVEWDAFDSLTFEEIKDKMKLFYIQFIKEINELSEKGVANYYVMLFQAFEYYPKFTEEIQTFYSKFEEKIGEALNRENINKKAVNIITQFEGILYWSSIFPNEKFEKLIHEI